MDGWKTLLTFRLPFGSWYMFHGKKTYRQRRPRPTWIFQKRRPGEPEELLHLHCEDMLILARQVPRRWSSSSCCCCCCCWCCSCCWCWWWWWWWWWWLVLFVGIFIVIGLMRWCVWPEDLYWGRFS